MWLRTCPRTILIALVTVQFVTSDGPNTPLFSDDQFHNLGLPSVPGLDQGRAEGLRHLQESPFRGTGPYADGPPVVRAEDYPIGKALIGSFRTPSLRELASTAPYGHNGAMATLQVRHGSRRTVKKPRKRVQHCYNRCGQRWYGCPPTQLASLVRLQCSHLWEKTAKVE